MDRMDLPLFNRDSIPLTTAEAPERVVMQGMLWATDWLRMATSSTLGFFPLGVLMTRYISPFLIRSTMSGLPSPTLKTGWTGTPLLERTLAVPFVATISNPRSTSFLATKTVDAWPMG